MERKQFYFIGDKCIACGRCALVCPESCIGIGIPYEIDQEKCVKCGTCYDACQPEAIVREKIEK